MWWLAYLHLQYNYQRLEMGGRWLANGTFGCFRHYDKKT